MFRGVAAASFASPANVRFSRFLVSSLPPPPAAFAPSFSKPPTRATCVRRSLLFGVVQQRSSTHPVVRSATPKPGWRVAFSSGITGSAGEGKDESREILVQHLLVGENDLELLLELQKRAVAGEDLSDLAVSYSLCPSKEDGGMLGWVHKGQMVPEFEEAAFSAPLNKVVRCKTKFGWHLLQVLSERDGCVLEDIDPVKFHLKMQDTNFSEEVQLIDVREPDEVAQASLPGFKILPLRQFGNWAPEITSEFDLQKDTYVLCHHGMRSLQVARWLQTQGFKRVFNIKGGIHAYSMQADASVPTY